MALIKANNAPANLVAFSMKDIEAQAQAILLRARQQAEQTLAAAQNEGDQIKQQSKSSALAAGRAEGLQQGRDEGYQAGMQQALDEHRSNLTQLVTALNAAAEQIEQSRRQLEENAATEVMKLAIAIASRVTKRQAALDSDVLTENVLAAVKMVVHSTDLRIAVHPSQKQTLLAVLPKLLLQWPNFEHVEIVEDVSLSPGGGRIYTRHGLIDADLDEQLNRIAAELLPSSPSPGTPAEGRGEGSFGAAQ